MKQLSTKKRHVLKNRLDKATLMEQLMNEPFKRVTVSFYRYVEIADPQMMRDQLFVEWSQMGVFGRTYVAKEGINAQISVPEQHWDIFVQKLHARPEFADVPFKIAVEDDGKSFWKLTIKNKHRILADGLDDGEISFQDLGKHITVEEMNAAVEDPNSIIIDMRNHYEYEVGRFEGSICPDTDTFREALPEAVDMVKDQKDKHIVLYCTGGIRCEKASCYFKSKGFENVSQLNGGIIEYAHKAAEKGLDVRYKGVNYVFDARTAERITDDVLSTCHQCDEACDRHVNCGNDACHLMFIQCDGCADKMGGHFCSKACHEIAQLPIEEQRRLRKEKKIEANDMAIYRSRERKDIKINA